MFTKFSMMFAAIPSGGGLIWVYLAFACVFEVFWILSLKMTNGFSHFGWTMASIPLALLSAGFLALAMRGLSMGTAYAIWTGTGTVGAVLIGMTLFREPIDFVRLGCIALILCGVTGLKITQGQ